MHGLDSKFSELLDRMLGEWPCCPPIELADTYNGGVKDAYSILRPVVDLVWCHRYYLQGGVKYRNSLYIRHPFHEYPSIMLGVTNGLIYFLKHIEGFLEVGICQGVVDQDGEEVHIPRLTLPRYYSLAEQRVGDKMKGFFTHVPLEEYCLLMESTTWVIPRCYWNIDKPGEVDLRQYYINMG